MGTQAIWLFALQISLLTNMSADQLRSSGQTFREVGRIARPWEEGRHVVCKMRKGVCMKIVLEDSKRGSILLLCFFFFTTFCLLHDWLFYLFIFFLSWRCTHLLCTQVQWTHNFSHFIYHPFTFTWFSLEPNYFTMWEIPLYSEKNWLSYFIKYKLNHGMGWGNTKTDVLASGTKLVEVANLHTQYFHS